MMMWLNKNSFKPVIDKATDDTLSKFLVRAVRFVFFRIQRLPDSHALLLGPSRRKPEVSKLARCRFYEFWLTVQG